MTDSGQSPLRVETALWLVAGAVLYWSFGFTEMQGSDLWWHIAAGREILQQKSLWLVDNWSYTAPGVDWHNHEWLSDLIFFGWSTLFGIETLVYWKWLVIVATFLTLHCVLQRSTRMPMAACACTVIAAAVAVPFLDVRPHLYTLLCYSILLWMLLNREARLWWVALLFLIWVNLHGGFFFGLMALAVLVFPWRDPSISRISASVKLVAVAGIVCLLNPDGVYSFFYPLKYAFVVDSPFRNLGEWISPFKDFAKGIRSPLFLPVLIAAPLVALAYALPTVRRSTGVPWEGLALCALTAMMAMTSRRFIPIFAISFAVMAAPVLAWVLRKLLVHRLAVPIAVAALAGGIYRLAPYPLAAAPAYHYLTAEYSYPVDMLDFIEINGLEGKVFARYNWGGYIHWRTDGRMKVFIDGRADTVYSGDTYNQYVSVMLAAPGWLQIVEASGADFFLWPYNAAGLNQARQLLQTGRWQLIYQDAVSYLAVRKSVPLPRERKSTPPTAWKYLGQAIGRFLAGDNVSASALAEQALAGKPYMLGGCRLLAAAKSRLGQTVEADAAIRRCLAYFPTRHLDAPDGGADSVGTQ